MSPPSAREWQLLDRVSWRPLPLATFTAFARDLEARFGPPVARDLDSNGVGQFDAHWLRFLCGLEVALARFHLGPQLRTIDPLTEASRFEVSANERDLEHIGFHLGVAPAAMSPWCETATGLPVAAPPARRLRLMRQDDNGNCLLVRSLSSRCQADALLRDYEARGHKQSYWVEEAP